MKTPNDCKSNLVSENFIHLTIKQDIPPQYQLHMSDDRY